MVVYYVKEHNFDSSKQQQRRARCSVVAFLIATHGRKP